MPWADCSRSVLLEVEDKEGNVVFLCATGVVTGKAGDFVEKGVGERSGRNISLGLPACAQRISGRSVPDGQQTDKRIVLRITFWIAILRRAGQIIEHRRRHRLS